MVDEKGSAREMMRGGEGVKRAKGKNEAIGNPQKVGRRVCTGYVSADGYAWDEI